MERVYSCESAEKTMEWMKAIADLLSQFKHLLDAHVTNFFKDRLWETIDRDWLEQLRKGPVEDLIGIPCGFVQEHWPKTLKEFVKNLKSLALPRDPKSPVQMFPDFRVSQLGSVISQGMNQKKKHEVEVLSAILSSIARSVGASTVIDVGSGQGYLAQVLSFMYHLSVIALDASAHHASVTSSRAERIKKHFMSQSRKYQKENKVLEGPRTITHQIFSSNSLTLLLKSIADQSPGDDEHSVSPLVLAGLHACGDLSANMLRTFTECEHVKAVACIGCCYNLLSDGCSAKNDMCCFPMSKGGKSVGLHLGKSARDLGCQSEERWKTFTQSAAVQNFQLHAFRAALQLILDKHYASILGSTPSIGRQGKSFRRKQNRRAFITQIMRDEEHSQEIFGSKTHRLAAESADFEATRAHDAPSPVQGSNCDTVSSNQLYQFIEFCKAGLARLGIENSDDIDFLGTWEEAQPYMDLIGPYWAVRAAFGPLVETYLLLDRLLFLQEQGDELEVKLFPLFDPLVSPRNVAIIAFKK